jgi:hypothetical protein
VLERPDVQFINLHYAGEEEIRKFEAQTRVGLHRWPDLDLKNDLENVAALMTELDVVISAPTTVAELAGALGVETWRVVTSRNQSNFWRVFPGTQQDLWHPSMTQINGEPVEDIADLMTKVGAALEARAGPIRR